MDEQDWNYPNRVLDSLCDFYMYLTAGRSVLAKKELSEISNNREKIEKAYNFLKTLNEDDPLWKKKYNRYDRTMLENIYWTVMGDPAVEKAIEEAIEKDIKEKNTK